MAIYFEIIYACRLLITTIISVAVLCRAQNIEIKCTFSGTSGYGCFATEFVIRQNETQTIAFVGDHLPGRSNIDVDSMYLIHPPLPFFVAEVFTTFPNLQGMTLSQGTLNIQGGSFELANNLDNLEISRSHVVLSDFALTGSGNLKVIQIADCETLRIDESAFVGLRSLETLLIFRSNIHHIGENTFRSLANLDQFWMANTQVKVIPAKLFVANTQLRTILLVSNPIAQIGRSFIDSLAQLEVLEVSASNCVSSNSWQNVREYLEEIHRFLEPCYTGYDELPRQFILELQGSLVIRDHRGDVVVRL